MPLRQEVLAEATRGTRQSPPRSPAAFGPVNDATGPAICSSKGAVINILAEPALNSRQTRRMSITCGDASRTRAFDGDATDGGSAMLSLYDMPELYDAIVRSGPCEGFYRHEAKRGGPVLELACGTGRLTLPTRSRTQ
jgi:hypothetical protein